MRNRGYTLVELLVVVAIIAIIAAMVMPVMLQAKEAARMRSCASSLKQLGVAICRYMDDHDGFGLPASPPQFKNPWILCAEPLVPNYVPQATNPFTGGRASSASRPYPAIGPEDRPRWIWICPGDTNRGLQDIDRPGWWSLGSSYRYPGPRVYLSGTTYMQKSNTYPRKPLTWKNLRRDILLTDHYDDFHSGCRAERKLGEPSVNPSLTPSSPYVKVKSINILFLDQHVRAVTPEQRAQYHEYTVKTDNPFADKP